MSIVSLREARLRLALLLLGLLAFVNTWAQDADINFPSTPIAGQPVTIEMYWNSCTGPLFGSDLYDVQIVGNDIQATVDIIFLTIGVCPPGTVMGWQAFQLPPLAEGTYTINIEGLPFLGDDPNPTGPAAPYATATFTVVAAPSAPTSHRIPALSGWSALLLILLAPLVGSLALRR
ncbi:MAG: hypothetical protein KDB22_26415 [Planctomycetales bacterium]|nr:hypothetical protein [Planctomycetales bacterium]